MKERDFEVHQSTVVFGVGACLEILLKVDRGVEEEFFENSKYYFGNRCFISGLPSKLFASSHLRLLTLGFLLVLDLGLVR